MGTGDRKGPRLKDWNGSTNGNAGQALSRSERQPQVLGVAWSRELCSSMYSWRFASTILPSTRALQSSLVARTLSKKFPARLLRPNYARERIGTQHERPAGCNVERSQRTQTRLPRGPDAPNRGRTLVRNRSAEALLIWVRTASGSDRPVASRV